METKVLTVRVPRDLAEKLGSVATRLDRSRDWIIEQALIGFIDQEEERRRLTLAALADVDSGRLVAHEAVQAWAGSLERDNPVPLPLPGPRQPIGPAEPSKC